MPQTIEAVLPLAERDLDRARILIASLDRYFPDLGTCWIVSPDRSVDTIQAAIIGDRYRVIPESLLIPELAFYRHLPVRRRRRVYGWNIQQLIKLAITPYIRTAFYLTLDADVICVQPFSAEDITRDGRGLVNRYTSTTSHAEWYTWAERVLGIKRSGFVHYVTPALFNTEAVVRLQRYLQERAHPWLRRLPWCGGWRGFLLCNLPWTEYSLYFTFLEGVNLFEQYHFQGQGHFIQGRPACVFDAAERNTWDPARAFTGERHFYFVVAQSTVMDTADVTARIAPFFTT